MCHIYTIFCVTCVRVCGEKLLAMQNCSIYIETRRSVCHQVGFCTVNTLHLWDYVHEEWWGRKNCSVFSSFYKQILQQLSLSDIRTRLSGIVYVTSSSPLHPSAKIRLKVLKQHI